MTTKVLARTASRTIRVAFLLCTLSRPALATSAAQDSVLHRYVDAVLSGDWLRAESLWVPGEIAASQRLGIQFEGFPAKFDCTSPLVQFRDAIRTGSATINIAAETTGLVTPLRRLIIKSQGATVRASYAMVALSGEWKLASPVYAWTRNWATRDTRFARVYCHDSSRVNDYALRQLDSFVDSVLQVLRVPAERMRLLETEKIDYYLGDSADVRLSTGYDTQGMTYFPLDAVITQYLPHYHEIVHVLANFALTPIPLYTAPWMQEGLAVALGGRWGKSPAVMMQLGAFVVRSGTANLEDVLTYRGFHDGAGTADISYALSGLLVRHLMENAGTERVLSLYRDLSGTNAQIQSFTLPEVQQRIGTLLGQPWDSTAGRFTEAISRFRYSGLQPTGSIPADSPFFSAENAGMAGRIWSADSFYVVDIRVDSGSAAGAFLFRDHKEGRLEGYRSRLFARQMGSQPHKEEALGIVFDDQEAGLYDYRTDVLLSKFATGFSMGETIWNPARKTVRFRLRKSASPLDLADCSCVLVRPARP